MQLTEGEGSFIEKRREWELRGDQCSYIVELVALDLSEPGTACLTRYLRIAIVAEQLCHWCIPQGYRKSNPADANLSNTHFSVNSLGQLLDLPQTYLASKPIFFPLHNPSTIGKHFSGFTPYPTAFLNSFITCSKLISLDRIVYDHAICTDSYFYFFSCFSYNVTLGKIILLLNFTSLIYEMDIIDLLDSQVYWKH